LYKRFTAVKPEEIFSGNENKSQLQNYAELASTLSKKIEALAYLTAVEEERPPVVVVPPVPEIKKPEIAVPQIPVVNEPVIPTVPDIKQPEVIVPQIPTVNEPVIPTVPVPEIVTPEVVPVVEKTTLPFSALENKQPEPAAKKIFPDVKSFIGLNEKLMFTRSLFKGEGTEYENAIAQVNNCASYSEAAALLQNFSATYNWNQDAEPVQVFYSIVKRRFA
jgi:hypothetical protein